MSRSREKKDTGVLTLHELEVLKKHTIEGKTQQQTAEELGVSRDHVKRIKRKPAYHELAQAALEQKGYAVENLVADLIAKTTAEKSENIGGSIIQVQDNVSQMKALDQIGKIYGVAAPQNINLNSTVSANEHELLEELNEQLNRTAQSPSTESPENASGALQGPELD